MQVVQGVSGNILAQFSSGFLLHVTPEVTATISVPDRGHPSGKAVLTPFIRESWEGDLQ